jgi:DNA-binding NarL/FixJ family response regulator
MKSNLKNKIRVMVVEDHVLVRMGLVSAARVEPDIVVVAEAEDGEQALALYREHRPDVVIMDLRLPGIDGVETISRLLKEFGPVRILVLTSFGTEESISRAIQAGAAGVVMKKMPLKRMLEAVRAVHAGESYFPPEIAHRLAQRVRHTELSPRELEVLRRIAEGRSNKEIGSDLGIGETTVKFHVMNLLEKLGAVDRAQAVATAIKRGILQMD